MRYDYRVEVYPPHGFVALREGGGRMAKGKIEKWLTGEGLAQLEAWARDGLTEKQIAGNIGICWDTLNEWKKRFPEVSEALKKGKEVVDIQVENALLKRAMGYTVNLVKTFKVKRTEYDENTGRKISEYEELAEGIDQVHVPADTTAQIFWLKNRKPDVWRDKRDVGIDGKINTGNPFAELTTEELRKLVDHA